MVAYAYAAQYPAEVEKLVLMDAFLPGVEGWEAIYNNPAIWHFRFNGPTPEALVSRYPAPVQPTRAMSIRPMRRRRLRLGEISALTGRIAEQLITKLAGVPVA